MRLVVSSLCSALLLALPISAFAQDAPADSTPASSEPESQKAAPAVAQKPAEALTDDAPFQIKRGLFAETDLGIFFTFGGRNTNDPAFPKKTISNIQPYLGVFFGYDIVRANKLTFAAGLKLAAGYSGGAGRVSDAQVATLGAKVGELPSDFGIMQVGAGVSLSYLVSERIAIVGKADGGMSAGLPNPLVEASATGAGGAAFGGIFGVGLGMEYFTLLNDFSVGLDVRFSMALLSGASIPGLGITIPVKYTF